MEPSHIPTTPSQAPTAAGLEPFEHVVAEHGRTVLRVCRAILGPHEAEDAWSETFLAALRAYPELDPSTNVQAWLVTIAKRKAIDQRRAAARNPVPVNSLPDQPGGAGIPDSPDGQLWKAVGALPRKQREAIAYHYLAGMPYIEVAGLLGNSESAARRAAADGMKNLRSSYQGARDDE
ncbi:RNA polymerase sigma factor [Arthrobacter castelli]|uniref:RNA polymerase sigma factor n=1 Tax=Arthrobacter castelli TaxID=271431 RepID=UPI000684B2B0|nr:sigma-70 family RNA polymerase sigma factor [Arthrobacter castelli]